MEEEKMAELKQIQEAVHKASVKNGNHDDADTTLTDRIVAAIKQLAQAAECIKQDQPVIWQDGGVVSTVGHPGLVKLLPSSPDWKSEKRPQGAQIQMADAVIIIMDIFESQNWSLENAIKIKHQFNTHGV
jgi:protoporphyrinogen oxidase